MKTMNRDWEQIKSAQQGMPIDKPIQPVDQKQRDAVFLDGDKALLDRHGLQELKNRKYWGVVERLVRNGIVEVEDAEKI